MHTIQINNLIIKPPQPVTVCRQVALCRDPKKKDLITWTPGNTWDHNFYMGTQNKIPREKWSYFVSPVVGGALEWTRHAQAQISNVLEPYSHAYCGHDRSLAS